MDEVILKTINLTKTYKNINALDNINVTIKKGQIYGLIGMNGAGKSTLMKIITGLSSKSSGDIELFSEHEESNIEKQRRRIGSIIETPGIYMNKTVYENMQINRMNKGIPGNECIDKILNTVGLMDIKHKKLKGLSMGTKQKVGIAMALLGDPEFLVLDEPINGIDPIGIIEIRELLKTLNVQKGVTILISSHILKELYQLANCYGIIHNGRLVQEITLEELNDKCKRYVHIKVNDVSKAAVIINNELETEKFQVMPDNVIRLYDYLNDTGKVVATLVKKGVVVEEAIIKGDDLESYFSRIVGEVENV